MEIIFNVILPYWLYLPEGEYKINFYNKRTDNYKLTGICRHNSSILERGF